MSHFCGIVFLQADNTQQAEGKLPSILQPFDAALEVESRIITDKDTLFEEMSLTIANEQKFIDKYKDDDSKQHPVLIAQNYMNLKAKFNDYKTADDVIQRIKCDYNVDEEGNEIVKFNPNATWDWWVLGGRWNGNILSAGSYNTNLARKEALTEVRLPSCFVSLDGEWHEQGELRAEKWEQEFRDYLNTVSDTTYLAVIDFHI